MSTLDRWENESVIEWMFRRLAWDETIAQWTVPNVGRIVEPDIERDRR